EGSDYRAQQRAAGDNIGQGLATRAEVPSGGTAVLWMGLVCEPANQAHRGAEKQPLQGVSPLVDNDLELGQGGDRYRNLISAFARDGDNHDVAVSQGPADEARRAGGREAHARPRRENERRRNYVLC